MGVTQRFAIWTIVIEILHDFLSGFFIHLDSGISGKYGRKITAESRYGKESMFTFLLPIAAKKSGKEK